jgi:hypothetical protein
VVLLVSDFDADPLHRRSPDPAKARSAHLVINPFVQSMTSNLAGKLRLKATTTSFVARQQRSIERDHRGRSSDPTVDNPPGQSRSLIRDAGTFRHVHAGWQHGDMLIRRFALVWVAATILLVPISWSGGAASASTTVQYYVTFYGWVDNSPPGPAIAHPCIHEHAGGVGTYGDPVTFAEHMDLHGPWCQIIYVPFLEKYFIHEDQCDPCGGVPDNHVDLWMGGNKASLHQPEEHALLACEDKWTRNPTDVVLDPPSNEPVDTTPLFKPPDTCHGGAGD